MATVSLKEKTKFEPDSAGTEKEKNRLLSDFLLGRWASLAIVKVERIEIGNSGWRVTYRE